MIKMKPFLYFLGNQTKTMNKQPQNDTCYSIFHLCQHFIPNFRKLHIQFRGEKKRRKRNSCIFPETNQNLGTGTAQKSNNFSHRGHRSGWRRTPTLLRATTRRRLPPANAGSSIRSRLIQRRPRLHPHHRRLRNGTTPILRLLPRRCLHLLIHINLFPNLVEPRLHLRTPIACNGGCNLHRRRHRDRSTNPDHDAPESTVFNTINKRSQQIRTDSDRYRTKKKKKSDRDVKEVVEERMGGSRVLGLV